MQPIAKFLPLLAVASTLVGVAAPAAAQLSASIGAETTSSRFSSAASSELWYVPLVGRYESGPLTLKLTVPWIRLKNANGAVPVLGNAGAGGGGVSTNTSGGGSGGSNGSSAIGSFGCAGDNRRGARRAADSGPCAATPAVATTSAATAIPATTSTTTSSSDTESGLGDVIAAATYNFYDNKTSGVSLDVTGKVKFATASESKGLGSGKNDYALQLDANKNIQKWAFYAAVGRKWLGDPDGGRLKNVWYGTLGSDYKVTESGKLGVTLDATTSSSDGPRPLETSAYFTQRFTKASKLNVYVSRGLSDANARWGAGVNFAHAFN
jgi:Putative MetA-pathway of phenol degradation